MLTIFQGEQRNGRIKFTTDKDCLAPDIIRFETRVFPDVAALMDTVHSYETRGFRVCVDVENELLPNYNGLYETIEHEEE